MMRLRKGLPIMVVSGEIRYFISLLKRWKRRKICFFGFMLFAFFIQVGRFFGTGGNSDVILPPVW